MFPGGRWLATCSRTPKTLATSPAEPKLCSLGSRACETLGIRDLLLHMKLTCGAVSRSDSSLTFATTRHHGQRRMESIDMQQNLSIGSQNDVSLHVQTWHEHKTWQTCLRNMFLMQSWTMYLPSKRHDPMRRGNSCDTYNSLERHAACNESWCYDPSGTASVNSASVQWYREHGREV